MEEIWKDIPNFIGLYQASNWGRIKSLDHWKVNSKGGYIQKGRILKPGKTKSGYLQVNLWKDGKKKLFKVHRLVWVTFNGEIPEGYEINHINEDKTDNRYPENLNLMTRNENNNYGTINQRRSDKLKNRCDVSKKVRQITYPDRIFVKIWPSTKECGRNGFNQSHVAACCRGELKQHKGFIFEYI